MMKIGNVNNTAIYLFVRIFLYNIFYFQIRSIYFSTKPKSGVKEFTFKITLELSKKVILHISI